MTIDHPASTETEPTEPREPLPEKLAAIRSACPRSDIPLAAWLRQLSNEGDNVSLRCQLDGTELFISWAAGEGRLYETEWTSEGVLVGPKRADPVRVAAAIETARVVTLVERGHTPLNWIRASV